MTKKLKILAVALILSGSLNHAWAVGPGFYLGLMAGPARNTSGTQNALLANSTQTTPVKAQDNQFGSRFFMGYKMNKYAAVEGGFSFFTKISYKASSNNIQTCTGTSQRVRDIDVVGKGDLPWGSFDIFAKGGVAVIYLTESGAFTSNCKNVYSNKFRPTMSLGAGYDLSQNWVTDLSWTRVMVGSTVKNIDFFALGVSYHFVDKYCGQFLCDD
jgi:hypothetical protein